MGPLILLENFFYLFRSSLWLHLVYGSSSVTQGDIQIGAKWSQIQRLRGSNGLAVWYKVKLCVRLSRGRLLSLVTLRVFILGVHVFFFLVRVFFFVPVFFFFFSCVFFLFIVLFFC